MSWQANWKAVYSPINMLQLAKLRSTQQARFFVGFATSALLSACATGTGAPIDGEVDASAAIDARVGPGTPDANVFTPADGSITNASVAPDSARADAMGCTTQTVNLLLNANFDGALGSWVGSPSEVSIVRVPPVSPDSSPNSAWLGGATSSTDILYQDVAIPADASGLVLSGRIRQTTAEILHNDDDILRLDIRNTSNVVLVALKDWDEDDDSGWESFSYNLADYSGQTIRVYLQATNDGDRVSSFFIDTMNLSTTTCL
ncbi:MAG: hypothetical protein JKY56_16120 [Kofleriaceae bacterium]|nr:hypothetical protein [Kofleriaceae bacterium]